MEEPNSQNRLQNTLDSARHHVRNRARLPSEKKNNKLIINTHLNYQT